MTRRITIPLGWLKLPTIVIELPAILQPRYKGPQLAQIGDSGGAIRSSTPPWLVEDNDEDNDDDDDGDPDHIHVVPIDDLIEHDTGHQDECPCGPLIDPVQRDDGSYGWVYVHHSLDGREKDEG